MEMGGTRAALWPYLLLLLLLFLLLSLLLLLLSLFVIAWKNR